MSLLDEIVFWHWWFFAGALLILELRFPQFVFLWLSFASAAVGFVLLAFPLTPAAGQLLLFATLSGIALGAWRKYRHRRVISAEKLETGAVHTLEQAIVDGKGRIEIGLQAWRVEGPDLPAGARIRILRVEGDLLLVEEVTGH